MFAINMALLKQFSAIKRKKFPQGSRCNHFENMTENVHVCFEEHIENN